MRRAPTRHPEPVRNIVASAVFGVGMVIAITAAALGLALVVPALAMTPAQSLLFNASNAPPSLDLNFLTGIMDSRINFSRASSRECFNAAGVLVTLAANVPCLDFDPVTLLPRGLLIEEQRTNSIRNNTMAGAGPGAPGTLPTDWSWNAVNQGTLAVNIVGAGVTNGISYLDLHFIGTPSGGGFSQVMLDTPTAIAASNGQTWAQSAYVTVIEGNLAVSGLTVSLGANELSGSLGYLASHNAVIIPGTGPLATQRFTNIFTNGQSTTAYIQAVFGIFFTSANAIDLTLRIGLPQTELGAFATSPILTTGSAATRAAEAAPMPTTSWFNPRQGTVAVELMPGNSAPTTYWRAFAIDGGAGGPSISVLTTPTSDPPIRLYGIIGFTGSFSNYDGPYLTNSVHKVGISYNLNTQSALFGYGGVAPQGLAAPFGAFPNPFKVLGLGSATNTGGQMNGWVRRFRFWPYARTSVQLQRDTQ